MKLTSSTGDLTLIWQRRTRRGGEWVDNIDASLEETSESYSIEILNGGATTILRTVSGTTESYVYSLANQVTDFGSAPTTLNFNVYQISSSVGRGQGLLARSIPISRSI